MKALDDDVRKVHETYWNNQQIAAYGHGVLLVEGDDDRDIVAGILGQRSRTWETRVRIVVAGGRSSVLRRMRTTFPQAQGLVDRDTWTDEEVAACCREEPCLHVTEGWCLENIFLQPKLLHDYHPQVAQHLAAQRERWVRAGAMWWVLQRTREAQQRWQEAIDWSYGSPRDDIELGSGSGLVASLTRRIPEELRREARFDVEGIAESFERRVAAVLKLPEAAQWQVGVHGKCAFNELLVPALQAALGQNDWRKELSLHVGRPAPLDALIAVLLPGG